MSILAEFRNGDDIGICMDCVLWPAVELLASAIGSSIGPENETNESPLLRSRFSRTGLVVYGNRTLALVLTAILIVLLSGLTISSMIIGRFSPYLRPSFYDVCVRDLTLLYASFCRNKILTSCSSWDTRLLSF